jgi:hypothetical protein
MLIHEYWFACYIICYVDSHTKNYIYNTQQDEYNKDELFYLPLEAQSFLVMRIVHIFALGASSWMKQLSSNFLWENFFMYGSPMIDICFFFYVLFCQ